MRWNAGSLRPRVYGCQRAGIRLGWADPSGFPLDCAVIPVDTKSALGVPSASIDRHLPWNAVQPVPYRTDHHDLRTKGYQSGLQSEEANGRVANLGEQPRDCPPDARRCPTVRAVELRLPAFVAGGSIKASEIPWGEQAGGSQLALSQRCSAPLPLRCVIYHSTLMHLAGGLRRADRSRLILGRDQRQSGRRRWSRLGEP